MMTPTVPMCLKHGNKCVSKSLHLNPWVPKDLLWLTSQKESCHDFKKK